jgi:hypothetical protein
MKSRPLGFTRALEAICNLTAQGLGEIVHEAVMIALTAHREISATPVNQRSGRFYRHLLPLRNRAVLVLTENYRRYLKLALAHSQQTGGDAHVWAVSQLQLDIDAALEWLRNWYILACDGENQFVRRLEPVEFSPGATVSANISMGISPLPLPTSWRAPAWLFAISPDVGVGRLKIKHVPPTDSTEKLSASHTRLLLKGAKYAFLSEVAGAIETARNEEFAAAGATPTQVASGRKRSPNKRKGWEQKVKLHSAIRRMLGANPSLQGMKFCAELDKRHAHPLYDWKKAGLWLEGFTWKEAWDNPFLRRRIRRVRQEAMRTVEQGS